MHTDGDEAYQPSSKVRKIEENIRSKTLEKIGAVFGKHISEELEVQEQSLEKVQGSILLVQKQLKFLRYAAANQYYSKAQGDVLPDDNPPIHPTVKKLLVGKRPKGFTDANPREESRLEKSTEATKLPQYVPPAVGEHSEIKTEIRGSRFKSKKRIIIGNISRWLQPDQRDESSVTHKWMVYVRGSKDEPDISSFVSKIKFYLHQSYAPNDIVEISAPPFQLSRRGWGEFPVRAQLFFRHPRDRPADIVHDLKLDKTYTGLQTLGGESVYDIMVHEGTADALDAMNELASHINLEPMETEETIEEPDIDLPLNIPPELRLDEPPKIDFECEIVTDLDHLESTLTKDDLSLYSVVKRTAVRPSTVPTPLTAQIRPLTQQSRPVVQSGNPLQTRPYSGPRFGSTVCSKPAGISSSVPPRLGLSTVNSRIRPLCEQNGLKKIIRDPPSASNGLTIDPPRRVVMVNPPSPNLRIVPGSIAQNRNNMRLNGISSHVPAVPKPNIIVETVPPPQAKPALPQNAKQDYVKCKSANGNTFLVPRSMIVNNRIVQPNKQKIQIWQHAPGVKSDFPLPASVEQILPVKKPVTDGFSQVVESLNKTKWVSTDHLAQRLLNLFPLVDGPERSKAFGNKLFSFMASSEEQIRRNWTIGKVRAAELYRARFVKKVMDRISVPEKWTVHQIIRWSRSCGYLPVSAWPLTEQGVAVKTARMQISKYSSLTLAPDLLNFPSSCRRTGEVEILDVETLEEKKGKSEIKTRKVEENKEATSSIIVSSLEDQEIANALKSKLRTHDFTFAEFAIEIDGDRVAVDATEAVLAKVWRKAAEELIRAMVIGAYRRTGGRRPEEVTLLDAARGVAANSRFSFLSSESLGEPAQLKSTVS